MKATDSRHLFHLPWIARFSHDAALPKIGQIVFVKGTTGMRAPKDEFIELAFFDDQYHPKANDHWFDMNNDHLRDRGFVVTHWCEL